MHNDIKNLTEIEEQERENTHSNDSRASSELSFKLDNVKDEALIE